ncbi:hypothetical protein VTL71DRAFT_14060 [Oculimacula yallundae]|uniref:Uncharacterized protein n=1 Tax=Oculimacula yallundae TaxID=86028 RepID=A0ABR4CHE4_9HELO
MAGNRQFI